MIYWIVYILSSSLLFFAKQNKTKFGKTALTWSGLLLLILLAALRSDEVGRDVGTYLKPLFNVAESTGTFGSFIAACKTLSALRDVETGFLLISYVTVKAFHNINVLFFVIESLIIIPNYIAINKFSKLEEIKGLNYSLPMALFSFCGIFYCFYLSGMRQGIACAFVTLALIECINKKKLRAALLVIIAFSMHHSGIIGFALILLYLLCSEKHTRRTNIIMGVGVVFALFYNRIFPVLMGLLQRFGLLNSKYLGWQSNAYYSSDNASGINVATLFCMLYALLISYLIYRKHKNGVTTFFFVSSFLAICLTPFIARYATFGRVNIYFQQLIVFIFPMFVNGIYKVSRKQRRLFATSINMIFILAYWVVTQVLTSSTDTLPYLFFWQ